ncbi:hypothetical protein SeMB42_g06919 [Synchytrium endobioticum]|uniref:Cytochrome P450 n=1 Tax=Synchytrium endobioticum TaxID=286115 RepID=A0A507CDD8_9FUNG|nr:hypothetical protein SeMB42_g06919 [Synchytrium endobioticum]TPX44654.1 hypothetical protein SeLEV6574_g04365 [Synchytrium endobioticum]
MPSKSVKSLALAAVGAALALKCVLFLRKAYIQSPLARIPGPWWAPLLYSRSLLAIGATIAGWTLYPLKTLQAHRRHGSVFRLGTTWISVSRGDIARSVLQSDAIDKPAFVYQTFRYNEYGDNLFTTLSHEEHKRMRKAIAPAFAIQHLRSVETYFSRNFNVLSEQLDKLIDVSPTGEVVHDMWQKLKLFMADCLGDSSFGGSFDSLKSCHGPARVPDLVYQIFSLKVLMAILTFLKHFPNPILHDAHAKTSELASYIEPLVDDRISGNTRRDDLLQVLVEGVSTMDIEQGYGDVGRLARNEIIANSLLMLSGGINTSSRSMAFLLINIIRHPHVYKTLQQEVDNTPLDPQTGLIPPEVCKQLPYLSACVNETLRLYGVTWIVRVLNCDLQASEFFFPKGTTIMVPLFVLMRDPSTWDNPDDFIPERFLDGSKKDNAGFLPFSTGEYTCIGRNFALNVMKICLANLLKKYEFDDVNPNHNLELFVDGFTSLRYLPYLMKVRKHRNLEP